jgi:L-amino acid N-acyltransferase YncA
MAPPIISLLPAGTPDIPTLAALSHTSFQTDTHTLFKAHYANYHHGDTMTSALESWISRPLEKGPVVKAVTDAGKIVGWAAWSFVGFEHHFEDDTSSSTCPETGMKEERRGKKESDEEKREEESLIFLPPNLPARDPTHSKIQHLSYLTSTTMSHYSSLLTPSPPNKTLILIAINIAPLYQGQGVGTALIKQGTKIADEVGAKSWVSSSHDGYRVFERCGFREVGRLEVRLDDFVDVDDEDEEDGGKREWGEYVWRYLVREVGGV